MASEQTGTCEDIVIPLVIGIGQPFRGDDQIGCILVNRIEHARPGRVRAVERSGEGAGLLQCWTRDDCVFLFDAVSSGRAPGTIHRIDAAGETLPSRFFRYSSHAFGVAEVIELARVLNTLPKRLIVYGVEGENFSAGAEITPAVRSAIEKVLALALGEIDAASSYGLDCSEMGPMCSANGA